MGGGGKRTGEFVALISHVMSVMSQKHMRNLKTCLLYAGIDNELVHRRQTKKHA